MNWIDKLRTPLWQPWYTVPYQRADDRSAGSGPDRAAVRLEICLDDLAQPHFGAAGADLASCHIFCFSPSGWAACWAC